MCRGRRKKESACESDFVLYNCEHNKGLNKSWAHLIKKIYEVDPLICPKYLECINFVQIPYLYLRDPEAISYKYKISTSTKKILHIKIFEI